MDTSFETSLGELCKKQDGKNLLKILVNIRKEVEWPKNREHITKLRTKGCLKHLIGILQMPQKRLVDVSLSILGNCIMDKGCAREAIGTYNILSPLNHLLKRYPKEDSINGRIFRILGNMCHHRDQWANIIIDRKPQIVTHVVELLKTLSKDQVSPEDASSEATLIMALRTLRLLLNSQTIIPLVKTFGVLKAVGSLFIKLTLEWQEAKTNEDVLLNIIRLLHDYSRYKFYSSIQEMRNTDRGDSLVYLCNVLLLSPKRIVKIIMNFIKISQLKSELPIPEICDRFIDEVLKKDLNIEEYKEEYMEYIQCLCYLLENPANRNSERCGKCLPLLIKVLEAFREPSNTELECCILMVVTLNNCRYDDGLVQEQLRCNVIQALVDKLKWVVGSGAETSKLNVDHVKVRKRKNSLLIRKLEWLVSDTDRPDVSAKKKSCQCSIALARTISHLIIIPTACYPPNRRRPAKKTTALYERSPSPCPSTGSDLSSLVWPPSGSPKPSTNNMSDSDSDDYSPVCSEADSTEFPPTEQEEVSILDEDGHLEGVVVDEEVGTEKTRNEDNIADNLKVTLITEIAKLINTYSRVQPPVLELACEDLLLALLNCSEYIESSLSSKVTTAEIICKILLSPVYLIPLMKTTFVEKIYGLTRFQHGSSCIRCVDHCFLGKKILRSFTELAESGAGKGDIAHGLLRGGQDLKEQLVLVIPYIVVNKSILSKLLLKCGGLNVLMRLLKDESVHKERTIRVLCALASNRLDIANPREVAMSLDQPKTPTEKTATDEGAPLVTFKLDDGASVKADRQFLADKSEYFSRLLGGHFKESNEDEVFLHNVAAKSLNCMLQLLKHVDKIGRISAKHDIDTLLDVIVLSDRYLMNELCCSLTNCIEKYRMSSKTVPVIYRWSLESGLNLLRVEAVAFALVENFTDATRFAMFSEMFGLGYTEELLDDIQKLLVRYLGSCTRRCVCYD
ncbi:hypothetical protein JTB14_003031 [Gonioctena quinquepunctata]|nr:hypothetical protein JTB14_003031 [Gonioctena quinquepunctata]